MTTRNRLSRSRPHFKRRVVRNGLPLTQMGRQSRRGSDFIGVSSPFSGPSKAAPTTSHVDRSVVWSASHDGTLAISISVGAAIAFVVGLSLSTAAAATPQSTGPSPSMTPYLPRRRRLHWLLLFLPRGRAAGLLRYLPRELQEFFFVFNMISNRLF